MFRDLILPAFLDDMNDKEILPLLSITDEDDEKNLQSIPNQLPILALKNTVLFPGVVIPITVGRKKSVKAVKQAHKNDKLIAVFSQKEIATEDPTFDDLYNKGTTAKVVKLLTMPDGSTTAILQGIRNSELHSLDQVDPYLSGVVKQIPNTSSDDVEFQATVRSIKDIAKKIIDLSPQIPKEASLMLHNIKSDTFLLNFIASNLNLNTSEKQGILEIEEITSKASHIHKLVDQELQMLEVKGQIESKVRGDIERQQRDYFLNQQLKTIQDELGDNPAKEAIEELEIRAKDKNWPEYAAKHFEKQIAKVKRINPQVAEYSVTTCLGKIILRIISILKKFRKY